MKYFLAALSFCFFLAFVVFTNLVRKDYFLNQASLSGIDFDLAVKLQGIVPTRLDTILQLLTTSASAPIIGIALVVVLFVFARAVGASITAFIFGATHALELFLKNMLRQSGPPYQFQRIHSEVTFDKDYQVAGYSYPSGHSFRVIFVLIVIVWIAYQRYGIRAWQTLVAATFLSGYASIVMVAKIAHGAHWTTDIVGGALLGVSTALICTVFIQSKRQKNPQQAQHQSESDAALGIWGK